MKRFKKFIAGFLVSTVAISCTVLPASAASPQTISGSGGGTTYTGRSDIYDSYSSARTSAGKSTAGVYAKTTYHYKNSWGFERTVSWSNNGTQSVSAQATKSENGTSYYASGEHAGVGWTGDTMAFY